MSTLPVIYQDRWLLIVDKPCGLPAQAPRGGGPSVFSLLQAEHDYVGLHHRLDTPASGLMALALHKRANKGLAEAFREHLARRSYRVMVLGDPGPEGRWDSPVDGKPAGTRFARAWSDGAMSLLEVELETGRTHQIRRHAAEAGHPVIGDRRHGGAAGGLWPRLALHAWRLALKHPVSGAPMRFEAPTPADLIGLDGFSISPMNTDS
ncbi:MAG: RluA family pseudouridine synthase [Alphaproteobacteria bacterium]|nr:RluA family pseudouridine synthase [Alphaproteobacteria bacterium]